MHTNPETDRRILLERALLKRVRMARADLKAGRTKTTDEVFEGARRHLMKRLADRG
jgi:hypothetical protein